MEFTFETSVGKFRIVWNHSTWDVWFENETLAGGFPSLQAGLDALVGGKTRRPSNGVDPTTLGLPKVIGVPPTRA